MSTSVIKAIRIRKYYLSGIKKVDAICGIDFQVEAGELMVIAGPSGSGKTTLLNICGLIESPSGGQLEFLGDRVDFSDKKQLTHLRKRCIGYVFQNCNLIPVVTAYENVEFPLLISNQAKSKRREQVEEALRQVGLWERRFNKPHQLSGGEQQRVAIARALVKKPVLVIADEPTANLDSRTTNHIIDLIDELNQQSGVTFILASHDPMVIKKAPSVLYVQDGRVKKYDKVLI